MPQKEMFFRVKARIMFKTLNLKPGNVSKLLKIPNPVDTFLYACFIIKSIKDHMINLKRDTGCPILLGPLCFLSFSTILEHI